MGALLVWRLDGTNKLSAKVYEWSAPAPGMPPVSRLVPAPAEPGEIVVVNGVKIVGHRNVPSRIAVDASTQSWQPPPEPR